MRRELVIPLQLTVVRLQCQYRGSVEVIALPLIAVHGRVRVAHAPEQRICLGVISARHPGGAASAEPGQCGSLPRLRFRLARRRNGPETPDPLAGSHVVGREEAAHSLIPARDSSDHHVFHHQRGRRASVIVVLRTLRHLRVPQQCARHPVQRDHMGVVRLEEHTVPQYRHAAVGAFGRIARDFLRAVPLVVPDRSPRLRIHSKHLVGAGDEHHPVHDQRRHLQREMVDREDPFDAEVLHVGGSDLVESAVAIPADVAVVGWPVARVRMHNLLESQSARRFHGRCFDPHLHTGKRTQEG